MTDEVLDGPDMGGQLFREGQPVTHQTGDTLPQGVVEALNVIGLPCFLRNHLVLCRQHDPPVDGIWIRMERRLLPVDGGQVTPSRLRPVVTAIADVKGTNLPRVLVHGHSDPLLVGLLLHNAPHRIHFHVKTPS